MTFKKLTIALILALLFVPTVSFAQVRGTHLEQQLSTIQLLLSQIQSRFGISLDSVNVGRVFPVSERSSNTNVDPLYIRITGPEELDRNERGEWRVRTEGDGDLTLHIDWDDGDDTEEDVDDRDTANFTHRYDRDGEYEIVFTLENQYGRRISQTMEVEVDNGRRNSTNDDDIEDIQISITNNRARVTVELEDGDRETFTVYSDDEDDIIEEIADRYDIDEDDVEDMIDFDNEDNDNDFEIEDIDPSWGRVGDVVELEVRGIDEGDEGDIDVFFGSQYTPINTRSWDIDFRSRDRATIEFEVPRRVQPPMPSCPIGLYCAQVMPNPAVVQEGRYSVWIEVDGERSNRVTFEVRE